MVEEYRRVFDDLTGAPSPPAIVIGTVYIDGEVAPDGLLLQAVIDGYGRGKCYTELNEVNEVITNFMMAVPDEGLHASEMGEEVTFYLEDTECMGSFIIESYGEVVNIEVYVDEISTDPDPIDPVPTSDDTASVLTDLHNQLEEIVYTLSNTINNIVSTNPLNVLVYGKRLPLSRRYLSEWITPRNLYVENAVLRILYGASDMNDPAPEPDDDEKFRHLFSIVCTDLDYLYDERIYGVDYWQDPEETLMRLAGDCEDTSFAMISLALCAGIPREKVRMCLGSVAFDGALFGHAWVEYYYDDEWRLAETTLSEELVNIGDLPTLPAEYKRELSFTDTSYIKYDADGEPLAPAFYGLPLNIDELRYADLSSE